MKINQLNKQLKINKHIIITGFIWLAGILGLPAGEITLRNLEMIYDGAPKWPSVTTFPERLTYRLFYRDRALPPMEPVSEIVYQNRPEPLELSYYSMPMANEKILEMGNILHPGGTARELEFCEATLVTWARARNYPALAAENPAGYLHPVTLSLYRVTTDNRMVPLITQTVPVMVPWRPETLPDGSAYPFSGHAFRISFFFPGGILLPERVLVSVGFSTSKAGTPKLPKAGPYDLLNLALCPVTAGIGQEENAAYSYINRDGVWNSIGMGSLKGPMLRLTAKAPQGETTERPMRAGVYDVRAVITTPDEVAQARGIFVVRRAPADISLLNPGRPGTPFSWLVGVGGEPADLPVSVTYNGEGAVPDKPGVYEVTATVTDPNYEGSATEVVRIGDSFNAWISRLGAASGLPEESLPAEADPDQDGLPNFLEYAFARDPALPEADGAPGPGLEAGEDGLSLSWRENPDATDLTFTVERSGAAEKGDGWISAEPLPRTVVSEAENVRVVKVTLPAPAADRKRAFFRVRVSH